MKDRSTLNVSQNNDAVPLLSLTGITKRYGTAYALSDAAFELAAGEVHALVGANGAGKSTLSRVISGHVRPDGGEMLLEGRAVQHGGTRDAIRAGIWMVTQETSLAPDLSVLENIMLPRLGMPGRLNWQKMRREGEALLRELGQEAAFELDTPVSLLSIGQRQLVEILKALALDSRIIIFDEPTASLSPLETELLFDVMRALVGAGARAHLRLAPDGGNFRDHRPGYGAARGLHSRQGAADARLGRQRPHSAHGRGRAFKSLCKARSGIGPARFRGPAIAGPQPRLPAFCTRVSFDVRAGDIVGLAGLVGAGRSETLETIFGLRQASAGSVTLAGQPFRPKTPVEAIRAGVGLIPETDGARESCPISACGKICCSGISVGTPGWGLPMTAAPFVCARSWRH